MNRGGSARLKAAPNQMLLRRLRRSRRRKEQSEGYEWAKD